MLKLKILVICLFAFQQAYCQFRTISGYVEDINSGERIIGAYVTDNKSKSVTQTNNFGFYKLQTGYDAELQASFIGLKSEMILLHLKRDTLINILMQPVRELEEVKITSSPYKRNANSSLRAYHNPNKTAHNYSCYGRT